MHFMKSFLSNSLVSLLFLAFSLSISSLSYADEAPEKPAREPAKIERIEPVPPKPVTQAPPAAPKANPAPKATAKAPAPAPKPATTPPLPAPVVAPVAAVPPPVVVEEVKEEVLTQYPVPPSTLYTMQYPLDVNPNQLEMQELKVQMRELAAQLLEVYPGDSLEGMVALPTAFVNLDDVNDTSSIGRYMGETMIYEFNVRGFPVQEYRIENHIRVNEYGEFVLSRRERARPVIENNELMLIGTYTKDANGLFVNARLVRNDGMVLRAGEVVLPMNKMLARMSVEPVLRKGTLMIRGRR